MAHKYNFENATSKRQADKDIGFITFPPWDGQVKHPEHLKEHEMLQVLQRETLNQNWPVVRKMIFEFPKFKRKDLIEMLKRTNKFFLIDKDFPDENWFRKRADENINIADEMK